MATVTDLGVQEETRATENNAVAPSVSDMSNFNNTPDMAAMADGTSAPIVKAKDNANINQINIPNTYTNADYSNMLNDMYNAQYDAGMQEFENAYNDSVAEYQRVADKIPDTYNAQRNNLSTSYEKAKRNYALMAAASGINTGTASQEQLSRLNEYQRNLSTIAAAEANAQQEIDFQLAALKRQKQAQVASLLNSNNLARAQAAINAWQDGRAQEQTRANVLAQYGDFSAFYNLGYSRAEVAKLETAWALQNKELAKVLNPEAYNMAYGTPASSGGSGYYYSGGGSGGSTSSAKTSSASNVYSSGELAQAAAAGATKSQIESALQTLGVDTNNKYVQADLKWAMSK